MNKTTSPSYLPLGLPIPVAEPDGLSAPYWTGLRHDRLLVQHCGHCQTWQFGPEWLCHRCHAFDPEWTEGCKSCSFLADHYNPAIIHLEHRDVAMVTVSRAPLEKLEAFKKRMGWTFKWVSSLGTDFNWDYHVSFTPEQKQKCEMYYNYSIGTFPSSEAPGVSVFYKSDSGELFHTYSSFARGLENFLGTYTWLDIVPKGRDEDALSYGMEWVKHHDRYQDASYVALPSRDRKEA